MPRNSSVRSSFSCKTEEDFRDEIMDLKRQLACIKEESKLLKVKLRRSEENAARKEKIICTLIDPMKAHLSAKSKRDHSKIPQEKGSSMKPVSKVHCQGLCSRAYRHDFDSSTQRDSNSRMISSAGQQRRNWKKKGNLKITTSMECLSPFDSKSSKLDLISCNKYGKKVHDISSCQRIVTDGSDNLLSGGLVKKILGRECDKSVLTSSKNCGKRKQINVSNKKRSENHARDDYLQFNSGGESLLSSPSLPCNLKEKIKKCRKGVEMKHGVNELPIDSIICMQCRLKALQKETNESANCSIENLLLEERKLVSLWNDHGLNTNKQIEIPQISETFSQDDSCGFSKFGIFLVKEGNEQESVKHTVADDIQRQTGDGSDTRQRTDSIFRVDIKMKEPKEETDYIEDLDLYLETDIGDIECVVGDDTGAFKSAADLHTEGEDSFRVGYVGSDTAVRDRDNLIVMDQMMNSISIIEQPVSSHAKKSDFVDVSADNDKKEMVDKQSTSSFDTKTVKVDIDKKHNDLYCNGINCSRTLSGGKFLGQNEKMLHKRCFLTAQSEEAAILGLILRSSDAEAVLEST